MLENDVSSAMPKRVVDCFEAVEVCVDYSQRAGAARSNEASQTFIQRGSIQKARQRVVLGPERELLV